MLFFHPGRLGVAVCGRPEEAGHRRDDERDGRRDAAQHREEAGRLDRAQPEVEERREAHHRSPAVAGRPGRAPHPGGHVLRPPLADVHGLGSLPLSPKQAASPA